MKYDLNNKQNRFAQRTLAAFSGSLLELIQKKKLENITIGELCEVSNYPRATFYNYFDDIYDLMDYCWIRIGGEMYIEHYEEIAFEDRADALFLRLYQYLDERRNIIQKVVKNNPVDGMVMNSFKKDVIRRVKKIMSECVLPHNERIPQELLQQHCGNTVVLLLEWCFLQEKQVSKEQALQYMHEMLDV